LSSQSGVKINVLTLMYAYAAEVCCVMSCFSIIYNSRLREK